jgi:hypothetical protein
VASALNPVENALKRIFAELDDAGVRCIRPEVVSGLRGTINPTAALSRRGQHAGEPDHYGNGARAMAKDKRIEPHDEDQPL